MGFVLGYLTSDHCLIAIVPSTELDFGFLTAWYAQSASF